jgi:hypothetical protein
MARSRWSLQAAKSDTLLVVIFGLLVIIVPAARAATFIDGGEHLFGATNINAVTGHGQLAEGVSADGDVTVLSWPTPSYADQLGYISSNAVDARSLPRFGAPEGAGLFLGLLIEKSDGSREVSWLRDRSRWEIAQSYGDDDGVNVVTRHTRMDLGLTVMVTDAIRPPTGAADVLVRLVRVARAFGSPVSSLWLLTYANLSPTPPNSRLAELPIVDWLLDGTNDFAAIWDPAAAAVMHFHPADQLVYNTVTDLVFQAPVAYGPIGEQLKQAVPGADALATLAATLDDHYAAGSYIALTTQPAPDQHQIGFDGPGLCGARASFADNLLALPTHFPGLQLPIDPALLNALRCPTGLTTRQRQNWIYDAADALVDAGDGELHGSNVAAGEVDEALRTPLTFSAGDATDVATAAVVLGFASTAAQARAAVVGVTAPEDILAAASNALATWLAGLRLPTTAPVDALAVARRALINLRVGTDVATGAAVASISRQPPYYLDWPRDGTFFNVALDISGQTALAGRRTDLYIDWQRRTAVRPMPPVDQPPPRDPSTGLASTYPAGSWEMNYFADGMVGGPIRFEIDNTALALWSIVSHVGWVACGQRPFYGPLPLVAGGCQVREAAGDYLTQRWDAISSAANLLTRWRDPATGLQAPASEDDNLAYTQTLHGSVTVFGALDIAGRAARLVHRDVDAARWEQRTCELRNAIGQYLYDAAAQRFVRAPGDHFDPASAPTEETAWLVWPTHVLPWDDQRITPQLASDLNIVGPTVRLENDGGSYFMKTTAAAALARGADPILGPMIADFRDRIAQTHATPATRQFGEVMVVVEDAQGRHASQRVSTPHLWEGILFYLTAMALEDPAAFDRYEAVLPASQVPPMGAVCPAIMVCSGDCDGDGTVTVDELIIGINIALGSAPLAQCASFDVNGDGMVTIDELLTAVNRALSGCVA